ncbi:MAG: BTAD domain-containing putative transcriptional regulator [Gemmatimonadaceae bacterium]
MHVSDGEGQPLSGAATQRRLLALLSVLAASGDAGLSRDKLVGLLWPDVEPERARHSLTQSLYSARRALRDDGLFDVTSASVRLDPSHITSDVSEFQQSLDRNELERAVELYEGPFLDGFFVTGAPEFEQWSSTQRTRLRDVAVGALERLASDAESRGELTTVVRWRRQAASLLPLDASRTVQLMTAMVAAGDRAGALQQARVHAALLRQELGLDADPLVESYAETLRTEAASSPIEAAERPTTATEASNASNATGTELATALIAEPVVIRRTVTPVDGIATHGLASAPPELRVPLWQRWAILSVVIVVLLGIGVLIGRARREPSAEVTPLALRQRVVVAPFRVAGADPSLAYLRDGMVELLSARLADDSLARSVDAGAVLGAWRAAGLSPAMDVPRDTIVKLATRLGAERVVVGSVVGSSTRTVLTATVLTLPAGTVSGQGSVAGPMDSLTTLIDRLAARLLVSQAGQEDDLSHFMSSSLPAVRAYLAAQSAFRAGDFGQAIRGYETALRRDSTFALAALHEALAADRIAREIPLRHGVSLAWAARNDLGDRDRSRLLALSGPRYPALPTGAELTTAWQHMVDLAPQNAESWYELALRVLHDGAAAGLADPRPRAIDALRRSLAVDSTHRVARDLLAGLLARDDSVRGDPEDAWRMLERASSRATDASERIDLALAQHDVALDAGRMDRVAESIARLRRLLPGPRAWLRLRVLDGLYGDVDSAAAATAANTLDAAVGDAPVVGASTSEGWLADACVLAQWRLHHDDTTQVRATIARLRGWRRRLTSTAVTATPTACAELLEASHAVVARQADARARVMRLDSLAFTTQVSGDAAAYAPIVVARLYERLGDVASARRALHKAQPVMGLPRARGDAGPRYSAAAARYERALAER